MGLDTHCHLLTTVWDASAMPWAPCKAQTTCIRQVMGHFSRHYPKGHGQTLRQTAALKVLPFLIQLHIHSPPQLGANLSVQSSVCGSSMQQVSAQTHTTALQHEWVTDPQGTDQAS